MKLDVNATNYVDDGARSALHSFVILASSQHNSKRELIVQLNEKFQFAHHTMQS